MNSREFLEALIAARGNVQDVERLPGASEWAAVCRRTCELRPLLVELKNLPREDQASFIKSLALFEQTIGGIGSPTLLLNALAAVDDPDHAIFDWVLTNTTSYNYYSRGAKSFADLQEIEARANARSCANLTDERQRAIDAGVRRAARASGNLFNAIRRGDVKAIQALLAQGADPETQDESGLSALAYADQLHRTQIAHLLRDHSNEP